MSKVSDPHKSYAPMQLKRDVFAAVQSTDAIREKGVTYLPKYPGEDEREYDVRKNASTIDGITASGVDVLTGAVFFDEIDTSKVLIDQAILENIDNKGNSFNYFSREAFKASFDGFSAIVIDMPKAQGAVRSLEDEQRFGMRSYLRLYKAKDVINWRYRVNPVSKQIQLAMIVLMEVTCEPLDRFSDKDVTRYRVFFLDGDIPKWEVWRKNDEGISKPNDEFILEESGVFTTKEIPVALIGEVTDDPKLLVESRLEVKAYQKESSYDTIEYMQIPTLWTKGYPADAPQIALGASTHIKLPDTPDAGVGYVQIDAAGQGELKMTIQGIKETIAGKVNEMIEAAVTEGAAPDQTATEAVIKDRDKQARLIVWADDLKDALERALQFMAQMMGKGEDGGGEIVLRTKWAVGEEMRQQAAEMKQKSDEATIAATNAKATAN